MVQLAYVIYGPFEVETAICLHLQIYVNGVWVVISVDLKIDHQRSRI